jgi:hypothetical protein
MARQGAPDRPRSVRHLAADGGLWGFGQVSMKMDKGRENP